MPDLVITQPDGSSTTVSSDFDKAEALNSFFAQETHLQDSPLSFPDFQAPLQLSPESFSTTPAEVFDTLQGLKPGKAPGPDDIPARLLQLCARGISVSLATLFDRSFAEGSVPLAWKEALVVPVYKGDSKSSPSNYRPIALLSQVSKVMEKIVLQRLRPFIDPLLSPKQSGFRKHDGTTFQLLRLVQEGCNSLDSSHLVGIVFFDFRKAFDRVCLHGLIKKLQSTGLQGKSLDWCCSFLSGRCQRVSIGGCVSAIEPLQAGVPQGGHS